MGDCGDLDVLGNNEPKHHKRTREMQSKYFIFTKFINGDSEIEFQDSLKLICEKFQYSHEICPKTGKLHYQGQLVLNKRMRRSQIVKYKHLNMFLDYQRGTDKENDSYILKNTTNHIVWTKEFINEYHTIRNDLLTLNIDDLKLLHKQLCLKNIKDKDWCNHCISIPSQLDILGCPLDEIFSFLRSDIIDMIITAQRYKKAESILNKYIH